MFQTSPVILLGFLFFIQLIVFILSRIGGWKRLADAFPEKPFIPDNTWSWQSLRFNSWCGYNTIATVMANREGLRLSLPVLFRCGHPPIVIPWREMEIREEPVLFGFLTAFRLDFPRCPSCDVTISRRLFAALERSGFPIRERLIPR
ncbi:MAG TPA: hypothetical protein PKM25_12490 [Candidatus Ozemobacteraceae bacterium]|nr:hypothetical protein [Candidatus Ozemobacteraceae bacterium]